MAVTLSLFAGAGAQFFDNNGNPLSGGKIYTYAAGTTTPHPTYTTNSDSSFHTNPIVLDAAGRIPSGGEIWLQFGVGYKFVVKTSAEVLIATYDNIPSSAQPPAANDADSIMYEQGYLLTAGSFVVGKIYRIVSVGTTDFTLIGATSNTIGTHFIATGVGSGTGTAELSQTVENKLRQTVSVKDFGATGDGTTDDTAAIHTAFDYAIANTSGVYFPPGTYRVTSGYDLTTLVDLKIFGVSASQVYAPKTVIVLDNSSAASYFMKIGGSYPSFAASNITFKCAQTVANREFFIFNGSCTPPFFTDVAFLSVEKPINFVPPCYFQSGNLTNVIFRGSGTIHSRVGGPGEGNSLRGTLLELNNVYVEDNHPTVNTHKVVMDLTGIREIQAINLLIECSVPAADWIPLVFSNPYNESAVRFPVASVHGLHIETPVIGGGIPTTAIKIVDGSVLLESLASCSGKIKLNSYAALEINRHSFGDTSNPLESYFDLADKTSQVTLRNCTYRNPGNTLTNQSFVLDNCSFIASSDPSGLLGASTSVYNTLPTVLYQWDGGYFDGQKGSIYVSPGAYSVSTDSSYGRKLVFANNDSFTISSKIANLAIGTQVNIIALLKLPTFTGGTFEIDYAENGVSVGAAALFTSAYSGQIVRIVTSYVLTASGLTSCGAAFRNFTTGSSGNIELYGFTNSIGSSVPKYPTYSYPTNIQTYSSAAPTTGTWAQGDVVWNNAPSSGGTPGWVCTSAGSPGTWKAMANLA